MRYEQEFEARGLEDLAGWITLICTARANHGGPGEGQGAQALQWTPLRCRPERRIPLPGPAGRGPLSPEDIIIQTFEGWLLIKLNMEPGM